MPDVIETTVYRLDELSEAAKDNARAWYREGGFDYDWYDAVYEDFRRIAEILGIRCAHHVDPATHSTAIRPPVPRASGHPRLRSCGAI